MLVTSTISAKKRNKAEQAKDKRSYKEDRYTRLCNFQNAAFVLQANQ
jgi:hypothetical protein